MYILIDLNVATVQIVVAVKELGGPTIKWRYVENLCSYEYLCLSNET